MEIKAALFGKTLNELKAICQELKLPGFTAKQMAEWLYKNHADDIQQMTNISKKNRDLISEKYVIGLQEFHTVSESSDSTKKYLFHAGERKLGIETAYIPDNDRETLCVSSQIGCRMGCVFCMTAKQGLQGNLSSNEILNQLRSIPEFESISNMVFMGMGEPLDNMEEVLKATEILTAEWGYAWSPRRITLSTIGILPQMGEFLNRSEVHLAISLHSPYEEQRQKLIPISARNTLDEIMKEVRSFDFGRQRRLSFEYIMFDNHNDSELDAKALAKLLFGLRCRVNLIRFHQIPTSPLKSSSEERISKFVEVLKSKNIWVTVRASRGEDIDAACGLLSTRNLNHSKISKA